MPDQVFRYAGPAGSVALYGDPFTIPDSWTQPTAADPDWVKKVWIAQLLATGYELQSAPFLPTYESGVISWPGNDGKVQTAAINRAEFPTQETADKLAEMYKGVTLNVPFFGLGPVGIGVPMRLIQFPNGATVPAYQLANYYTNNPEDKFPGDADHLCRLLIARVYTIAGSAL